MNNLVEVTVTLDPTDAAKLVDLAGGEENVSEDAATLIQCQLSEEDISSADPSVDQTWTDAQLRIDMYG